MCSHNENKVIAAVLEAARKAIKARAELLQAKKEAWHRIDVGMANEEYRERMVELEIAVIQYNLLLGHPMELRF